MCGTRFIEDCESDLLRVDRRAADLLFGSMHKSPYLQWAHTHTNICLGTSLVEDSQEAYALLTYVFASQSAAHRLTRKTSCNNFCRYGW